MPEGDATWQLQDVTVLFSGIRSFSSLAKQLDAGELAELLGQYSGKASQSILENGGGHLRSTGDGLVAVFTDVPDGSPLPSARRAISAALALALAAHEFRRWLAQRFPAHSLSPFAIGVGLHCGNVTLCRLGSVHSSETMPIGETVNIAARLQTATRELGWTVAASSAVLAGAGQGIQTGAQASLGTRGKLLAVDALEVTGLVIATKDDAHGMTYLTERALAISAAVTANSEITAHAAKNARDARLSPPRSQNVDVAAVPVRLKGYRIVRKIASGGMTEVYLAERQSDGLRIVLKILHSHTKNAFEHLAPFIREYALLSKITHPHVIRIYDQGFTDDHVYIAMEYFERGDLRQLFGVEMTPKQVLGIVRQIASALDAIHKQGIVHCDIKPENIMQRVDGSVALADFGIARSTLQAQDVGFPPVRHNGAVGTPYYMSPEQASSEVTTAQSDLYSLGVMMFEMLAGRRPFTADSLDMLLAQHLNAQTPALPPACTHLQGIVDKLMRKELTFRYASAQELMADMDRLQ